MGLEYAAAIGERGAAPAHALDRVAIQTSVITSHTGCGRASSRRSVADTNQRHPHPSQCRSGADLRSAGVVPTVGESTPPVFVTSIHAEGRQRFVRNWATEHNVDSMLLQWTPEISSLLALVG